jgi:glycosyltransferase involved in cell wall biosynthesis
MQINSLSIIFPLFDEEKRLPKNLKKITKLLSRLKKIDFEIILINDGSKDRSDKIITEFLNTYKSKKFNKIKYFFYKKNRGKGFALKKGISLAKKKWILTCDIDFAANPNNILNWCKKNYIKSSYACYFGSRNIKNSKIKYRYLRKIIGEIFTFFRKLLFKIKTSDSQCGFKLYPKKVANTIFASLKNYGYIHDVEVLILLKKNKIKIYELPVKWTHMPGSKVNLIIDSIKMFFQLFYLKIIYRNV